MSTERTAEEWGKVAVSLPNFPSNGMVGTIDTPNGEVGFGLDGLIWRRPHSTGKRSPWVIDVDHPATAGCLLVQLGLQLSGWWVASTVLENGQHIVRASRRGHARVEGQSSTLGRACIAAAEALGYWPGGKQ